MYAEMASLIRQDQQPTSAEEYPVVMNNSDEEEKNKGEESDVEDDDDDDDFGTDRDINWKDARQRKKSPFRGKEPVTHPHQVNALEEEIKHDNNSKQYFDHTLQTI